MRVWARCHGQQPATSESASRDGRGDNDRPRGDELLTASVHPQLQSLHRSRAE